MKRSLFLGVVIGFVFSLALPFHLMAQTTPLKLVIETSNGDRIGGAQIQGFSLAPDNTLIINVGSSGFDFLALLPDISIVPPCTNCNITGLASVSAAVGNNTISFSLFSNTPNTSFSLKVNPDKQDPASAGLIGTVFGWDIGGPPPVASGAYLAVFEATDGMHTSQLPVTITITPPITVTAPTSVTGPTTGSITAPNSFTASGATTSQSGDSVQYQFDWGDGSQSSWGSGTQSKTWAAAGGPYTIKARAASVAYPTVQSGWTTGPAITISQSCQSTVAVTASGTGGTITSATSQTAACGTSVRFSGSLTSSSVTATVPEGTYSTYLGTTWYWDVTTPATATTKTVNINFSGSTSCNSTVTATVNTAGGSITSTNPVTTTCGSAVTFSGTFNSGYSSGSATEGTFSAGSLNWNVTGIVAPATNGGTKTVSITLTGSIPPPTTGCDAAGSNCTAQVRSAVSLNFPVCDSGFYGYTYPLWARVASCPARGEYRLPVGTTWFLVDAAAVGKTIGNLTISILDMTQGAGGSAPRVTLYPLDANDNVLSRTLGSKLNFPYQMAMPYSQGISPSMTATTRYLVKVVEATVPFALTIYYQVN